MEFFSKLMSALGVWHRGVDVVGNLPVEVAEIILQKLDPRSLLNAANVSQTWMSICKGSSRLRKSARSHLRKEKRRMIQDYGVQIKQVKTTVALRVSRMQTSLAQRVSKQSHPHNSVHLVKNMTMHHTDFSRKCMSVTKSPSNPPKLSTRSLLRLR